MLVERFVVRAASCSCSASIRVKVSVRQHLRSIRGSDSVGGETDCDVHGAVLVTKECVPTRALCLALSFLDCWRLRCSVSTVLRLGLVAQACCRTNPFRLWVSRFPKTNLLSSVAGKEVWKSNYWSSVSDLHRSSLRLCAYRWQPGLLFPLGGDTRTHRHRKSHFGAFQVRCIPLSVGKPVSRAA